MDTPEPDSMRHTEIIDGIALTHIKLDNIEKLVGGGELQILQKRYNALFAENRRLNIVIGQAYESLEDINETTIWNSMDVARRILLRKGDGSNSSYSSPT